MPQAVKARELGAEARGPAQDKARKEVAGGKAAGAEQGSVEGSERICTVLTQRKRTATDCWRRRQRI